MPTAEQLKDLTMETLETAKGRAEHLAAAVPDIDLSSIEVPRVDAIVHDAAHHRVRTTLVAGALVLVLILVLRKVLSGADETADAAS